MKGFLCWHLLALLSKESIGHQGESFMVYAPTSKNGPGEPSRAGIPEYR